MSDDRDRDTLHEDLAPTSVGGSTLTDTVDTNADVAESVFDAVVSRVIDRHVDAFKDSLKASVHEILDEISNEALATRHEIDSLTQRVVSLERWRAKREDDGK
jgi:polyhydroxyalkanoate synthesis regulator phasin